MRDTKNKARSRVLSLTNNLNLVLHAPLRLIAHLGMPCTPRVGWHACIAEGREVKKKKETVRKRNNMGVKR